MAQEEEIKQGIDFKRVFIFFIKNWYVFVLAIIGAMTYSKRIIREQTPVYSVRTTLLVKDESQNILLPGGISSVSSTKTIDNEIEIMKSNSMIEVAIDKLEFMVSYYAKSKGKTIEIYKDAPFIVEFDKEFEQVRDEMIDIKFKSNKHFTLNAESFDFSGKTYELNQWIENEKFKFLVKLRPEQSLNSYVDKSFIFKINSRFGTISEYGGKIKINKKSGTSILEISSKGTIVNKEKDFLDTIAMVYIQNSLNRKNDISDNRIRFIDNQIEKARQALDNAARELEAFRRRNKLMKLDDKVVPILARVNSLTKNKADQNLNLQYYTYLRDYMKTHNEFDDLVSPATIGLTIPLFSKILGELQQIYLEKEYLIATASKSNPYIKTLETKIAAKKKVLLETISNTIKTSTMKINDFDKRINMHLANFEQLPSLDRQYIEIMRMYTLNSELYNFFLKKRFEAEISKTNNATDLTQIEPAGGSKKIAPNAKSTKTSSLIFAIIIPCLLLFALYIFLSRKISHIEDINKHTNYFLIGKVYHNYFRSKFTVSKNPYTFFAQAFKKIRSQINLNENSGTVIAVTSSKPGEGKSFISLNLALVYALTGRKTLLVDTNFYKPIIAKYFNEENNTGFSDYFNQEEQSDILNQIILKEKCENLDVLLSGQYNGVIDELFNNNRMEELFEQLIASYDIIVIDTSALSISTDIYELKPYIDSTLFVIRDRFTLIKLFSQTLKETKAKELLPNVQIVYNNVRNRIGFGKYLINNMFGFLMFWKRK